MGVVLKELGVPVNKGTNGIIALETDHTVPQECIKCGRCVDVCPMELRPLQFYKASAEPDGQTFKDLNVMDCMECGCCEYICSSKIKLLDCIRAGKSAVWGMK